MKLKVRGSDKQKSSQYPEIGDQLDAIWKIIKASNLTIPEEAKEISNKIQKVKDIFKKMKFEQE